MSILHMIISLKHLLTYNYDKHCPVKKNCSKVNGNKIKPWFTSGLRNACKKKNNLYRKFLQCRSKSAEEKYKVYKNKLTTILRNSEKIYYSTLLDKEKNNIKGTWKILNTIIRKGQQSSPLPDKFMTNGKTVTHTRLALGCLANVAKGKHFL